MQRNRWDVASYPPSKSKQKKKRKLGIKVKNTFDPLTEKEPNESIMWGLFNVGVGITSHMVAIYENWIFDSNYNKALPRTQESLDICCNIYNNGQKFDKFAKLFILTPRINN